MAVISAGSVAALSSALKSARPGDVIQLEAGTYSNVVIRNFNLGGVVVESKNPAKPAVFTDLYVRDVKGLTFQNLEFFVDRGRAVSDFTIAHSSDVRVVGVNMHGLLDGNPQTDKLGLLIQNSSRISVTGSEFHELRLGVQHIDSSDLIFSGNSFHDLRLGGIWGGGSSNVTVSQNFFTNFFPVAGDHPDAVNFWTTGTTAPAKNITISGNVYLRGEGGVSQGIFLRDQQNKLPFENVKITDNLIVGGLYNGIAVTGGKGITISGNTVVALPDQKSRILVDGVSAGEVSSNHASDFIFLNSKNVVIKANHEFGAIKDGGKAIIADWLAGHGNLADLPALPADGGAPKPKPDPASPAPVPLPADSGKGGAFADAKQGTDVNDTLAASGKLGTALDGRGGNDYLSGGKGSDRLTGGNGDDRLFGGDGADIFHFEASTIHARSDVDRIFDLDFAERDSLSFSGFGAGTFASKPGIAATANGSDAMITSFAGMVNAATFSTKVTAFKQGIGNDNLVFRVIDADNDVQDIVITNGWSPFVAAGGSEFI